MVHQSTPVPARLWDACTYRPLSKRWHQPQPTMSPSQRLSRGFPRGSKLEPESSERMLGVGIENQCFGQEVHGGGYYVWSKPRSYNYCRWLLFGWLGGEVNVCGSLRTLYPTFALKLDGGCDQSCGWFRCRRVRDPIALMSIRHLDCACKPLWKWKSK